VNRNIVALDGLIVWRSGPAYWAWAVAGLVIVVGLFGGAHVRRRKGKSA
jgi:hypothetical protein